MTPKLKIIVFAPHPDDECHSCGGSILKWLEEGHDVHIICFTDGRAGYRVAKVRDDLEDCEATRITEDNLAEIRLAEADNAADFLGVRKKNRHFLKFHDQDLKNHIDEAVDIIKEIVKDADRFVIPSANNNHPDHQATHDIAIKVAKELNLDNIDFYVYALYNTLKAGNHLFLNKIGDLRLKVYDAVKLHKSLFYIKSNELEIRSLKSRRKDKFGVYKLYEKGQFYNF
jgi:LmbE family N-acetylglucosaminyl deacetylase